MKQCPQCGRVANDNERFCSVCGASLQETINESANNTGAANSTSNENITNGAQSCRQPVQNAQPAQPTQGTNAAYFQTAPKTATTKKEFLKLEENKKLYTACRASAILCYICAGISVVLMCFILKNWFSIFEIVLIVGLGLGIHLKQSRVCAIILLIYSVINSIFLYIGYGRFGGWLVILAGIYAVIATFNANNAWKEYQQQAYQQQIYNQQPPYQQ